VVKVCIAACHSGGIFFISRINVDFKKIPPE